MKITINGVVIDNPRSLTIHCELTGDETLEDSSDVFYTEGQPEADVPALVSSGRG